ncbi:hypothetical protein FBU30_006602 [Linnemannia zychae]|nr:hypothetical protein FBU30_006602 [Linnemannia zychae]
MTPPIAFNRVTTHYITSATKCRCFSSAIPRWPNKVYSRYFIQDPFSRFGSGLLPTVASTAILHPQRRYISKKSSQPISSPSSTQASPLQLKEAKNPYGLEDTKEVKNGDFSRPCSNLQQQQEKANRQSKDGQKDTKEANEDPRKEAVEEKQGLKTFQAARLPIVLCHGFSGFDSLGTNPDFRFDYWYGVREALDDIGVHVHTARVPPFAGIQHRAEALRKYITETVPHGSEINLIGHSMGGLDCRYLISHLQSPHFKVRSLTTLGTPHRGSPFADYVMSDIVGRTRLETFWTMLGFVGIERGAAENLTTYYLKNEFNPNTPNQPDVSYFSYAASFQPGFFSRFRFPWQVIMEHEGPNDGLVSVKSAQWGEYIRTIPNADHMDLMNWVNALSWSRARFPWILGGSSHDPQGRPKGAFERDNDDEEDKNLPREEPELFNAIELYLEISDMLYKHGL